MNLRNVLAILFAIAAPASLLSYLAMGCSPGSPAGGDQSCPLIAADCPATPPSWKTDVAPLITQYCGACHGDGGVEQPTIDLSNYAGVFKNRFEVQFQVYHCEMPQADASPPVPQLSNAQRETIVAWAACSAPNN
jgi:hypothetical protein